MLRTLLFFSLIPALIPGANACDGDGCNTLVIADLPGELATWPDAGHDCNGDGGPDLLDLVCLISQVPGLAAPVLDLPGSHELAVGQTLDLTLTAVDPNGDPLLFSARDLPAGASLSSAGQFSFTPGADQIGLHLITIQVSDGFLVAAATLAITVANPLVALDQDLTVNEDQPLNILLGLAEPPTATVVFQVVDEPQHGSLLGTAPSLTYQGLPDYHGPDFFTFRAVDGAAASNLARVDLTVLPINDPPRARDLFLVGPVDNELVVTLVAVDSEGDPLTYMVIEPPTHGQLIGAAPNLVYQPDPGFSGNDRFSYRANDGQLDSQAANVSLSLTLAAPLLTLALVHGFRCEKQQCRMGRPCVKEEPRR